MNYRRKVYGNTNLSVKVHSEHLVEYMIYKLGQGQNQIPKPERKNYFEITNTWDGFKRSSVAPEDIPPGFTK